MSVGQFHNFYRDYQNFVSSIYTEELDALQQKYDALLKKHAEIMENPSIPSHLKECIQTIFPTYIADDKLTRYNLPCLISPLARYGKKLTEYYPQSSDNLTL